MQRRREIISMLSRRNTTRKTLHGCTRTLLQWRIRMEEWSVFRDFYIALLGSINSGSAVISLLCINKMTDLFKSLCHLKTRISFHIRKKYNLIISHQQISIWPTVQDPRVNRPRTSGVHLHMPNSKWKHENRALSMIFSSRRISGNHGKLEIPSSYRYIAILYMSSFPIGSGACPGRVPTSKL